MKIYHTLGGSYFVHGREFPIGTVVLELDDGINVACCRFNTPRNEDLAVWVYIPGKIKWQRCMLKNQYTEMLWDYYRKNKKKIIPKHISMKTHKKIKEKKNKGTKPKVIPKSVKWAATHPYQGGRVSPR